MTKDEQAERVRKPLEVLLKMTMTQTIVDRSDIQWLTKEALRALEGRG